MGWAEPAAGRPIGITDLNSYVNAAHADKRPWRTDWCNQVGAGIVSASGRRAALMPHASTRVDQAPGESDGAGATIAGDPSAEPMCDSTYRRPSTICARAGRWPARGEGAWFDAAFEVLVSNAYPPL